MGLDSVELLMEVEKFFDINIPDLEAEKIYTIQNMVDSVAGHLNITNESMKLRDSIFEKVVEGIHEIGWTAKAIELSDYISSCIPANNKEDWKALSKCLKLSVPKPDDGKNYGNKISVKLKNLLSWSPDYNWEEITIEQFVAAVCANNYLDLIEKTSIRNKYEIYIAVMAITVDKIGVDYYEVGPDKSFTSDLGVD